MSPTVHNPTADGLEIPAPALHDTQAVVIPANGAVVVSPAQAEALKNHPVLKVHFEEGKLHIGDDDASSLSVEETEAEKAALNGQPTGETHDGDGNPIVDESDAGDDFAEGDSAPDEIDTGEESGDANPEAE